MGLTKRLDALRRHVGARDREFAMDDGYVVCTYRTYSIRFQHINHSVLRGHFERIP